MATKKATSSMRKARAKGKSVKKPASNKTVGSKATVKKQSARKSKTSKVKTLRTKASSQVAVSKGSVKVKKPSARKKTLRAGEKRKLRDRLLSLRERIAGQIDFLAKDNLNRTQNDTEVNFRSEEQGTDNYDRDFALNRVSLEQDVIFEIDEALNRIQLGTYGVCETCDRQIEKARLAALPYSRLCVSCKSQAEEGKARFRPSETPEVFSDVDRTLQSPEADEE